MPPAKLNAEVALKLNFLAIELNSLDSFIAVNPNFGPDNEKGVLTQVIKSKLSG